MKALVAALKESSERTRLLLLGLSGATAAVVGFRWVPVATAKNLIQYGGYYYILAVFLGACYYGIRIAAARRESWLPRLRRPGVAGAAIVLATLFLFWSDTFKHKILFDEYVLQGTAYHMHATKEIGAVVRAYDINGSWLVIDTFLDKRPYFFAFLVSLLHDLTGYRVANIFVVNALLTPVLLGLVYWLARELTGLKPALFSLALLATLPLLGQNVSCAGMELHNLTMIAAVMVFAVLYLRSPSPDRLSLLVLATVLLSQSRYESVIFVGPTALVILLGWRNAGRVIMSWPAVLAPLLLIPYAWHNRILSESPVLWQLNAGQTSRFSTSYLANNLEGAWVFFFNHTPAIANSFLLSLLGVVGLGAALLRGWVWYRSPGRRQLPAVVTVSFLFGLGIAGNLGILMFYYWSRLDDVIASRFALPMCLMLALTAGFLLKVLEPRPIRAMRTALVLLLVWFFGWDLEAYSEKQYTNKNLVMQEIDWEHDFLKTRPGPVLFISNMSTIPFILWQIPCILSQQAPTRVEQLRYHLNQHTFSEMLIAQSLRPSDAQGDLGVDPSEVLPDSFKLQTLRIERFGSRCTRISRIVSIDPPPATKATPKPKGLASSP